MILQTFARSKARSTKLSGLGDVRRVSSTNGGGEGDMEEDELVDAGLGLGFVSEGGNTPELLHLKQES